MTEIVRWNRPAETERPVAIVALPPAPPTPSAPALPPTPTADEAQAAKEAAQQAIADHLERLATLEAQLVEARQRGQTARSGTPERKAAAGEIGMLEAEIELEKGDRPALDEALRLATVDVIAVRYKQQSREMRQHNENMAVEADNVKAARARLDAALAQEQTIKAQSGRFYGVREQNLQGWKAAGLSDAEINQLETKIQAEISDELKGQ